MCNQLATFKDYNMNQLILPMDYSDLIPENHVARVVNDMVNRLDDHLFFDVYKGGGRPAYHPKMMTKIILYGYTQKMFSCRDIANALRENLPMMWLASQQSPDFRTINRFRSERLKPLMDTLFTELTKLLITEGYIDGKHYFLDGTKIEANANKYSFVWKKSVLNYEEKLQLKVEEMLQAIDEAIHVDLTSLKQEDALFEKDRISSEALQTVVDKVEEEMKTQEEKLEEIKEPATKKEKKKEVRSLQKTHRTLLNDYLPRLQKYEHQVGIFGERNSFSKTDTDATFMRMKEDHMNNGQLKAGYNWQVGTQDQFILFYTVHHNPTDTRCLEPHIAQLKEANLPLPEFIIADAGYGSESNYVAMEEEEFETLIPYNTYRQEQKRSFSKKRYHPHNWDYDEKEDLYWCPNNRKVPFLKYSKKTDRYGYTRDFKIYECETCEECPFKSDCTKAKGNRQVHFNPVYEDFKAQQNAKLNSEEGGTLYQKRKIDVESVFGHVKQNLAFRRLHLRGSEKVKIELGLVALAHNMRKRVAADRHSQENEKMHNKNHGDQCNQVSVIFSISGLLGQPLFT